MTQLQTFSFQQKQQIISMAMAKLTAPQKFLLNILKLLLLIPPFWFLAQLDTWLMVLPVIFLLFAYFIIIRPLTLSFAATHLSKAVNEYNNLHE